jgi:putative transposase
MKEYYRHRLPHFQQPGQAYFITWSIKDAVPPKALIRYSNELHILRSEILLHQRNKSGTTPQDNKHGIVKNDFLSDDFVINQDSSSLTSELRMRYYILRKKYLKAYDDILNANLNPIVNLCSPDNLQIIKETLHYWSGKKIENYAFCIMPNHVHWVLRLHVRDEDGNAISLQDILYSVKRFSATQINKSESRNGCLWQAESFETTIRNDKHLYNAIEYTLNNPVSAGLVEDRESWPGNWYND